MTIKIETLELIYLKSKDSMHYDADVLVTSKCCMNRRVNATIDFGGEKDCIVL